MLTTPSGQGEVCGGLWTRRQLLYHLAMPRKGSLLRAWWAAAVIGAATLPLSLTVMLLAPVGLMSASGAHQIARLWAKIVLWAVGVRLEAVEGLTNLPPEGGYVLAPNHLSWFDIPVIMAGLPIDLRWLAKESLFKIPFMGWAMKGCGYIPVDREDSSKALGLLKKAAKRIRSGAEVIIFPEGTRNPTPSKMLPFKRGAFLLARLACRPVVPVALMGTEAVLPRDSLRPLPGGVAIRIGRPIDPDVFPRGEIDLLINQTRLAIEALRASA